MSRAVRPVSDGIQTCFGRNSSKTFCVISVTVFRGEKGSKLFGSIQLG